MSIFIVKLIRTKMQKCHELGASLSFGLSLRLDVVIHYDDYGHCLLLLGVALLVGRLSWHNVLLGGSNFMIESLKVKLLLAELTFYTCKLLSDGLIGLLKVPKTLSLPYHNFSQHHSHLPMHHHHPEVLIVLPLSAARVKDPFCPILN